MGANNNNKSIYYKAGKIDQFPTGNFFKWEVFQSRVEHEKTASENIILIGNYGRWLVFNGTPGIPTNMFL